MTALAPGMLCKCTNDTWWNRETLAPMTWGVPRAGGIYAVIDAFELEFGNYVSLDEFGPDCIFNSKYFVPLDARRLDIFRQTTTDIPEKVEA